MKLTAEQYLELEYNGGGGVVFECASCDATIEDIDLVSPCHPDAGFLEPSGHGGLSGMHIYCQPDNPSEVCDWGGPVVEFEPQALCCMCRKSPFIKEEK